MLRKPIAAVAVILLTGALALGQNPPRTTFTVDGTIFLDSGNRASERIEVFLETISWQTIARSYSDSLGRFQFTSVPVGVYEVVVRSDAYEETRTPISPSNGRLTSPTVSVTISLHSVARKPTPATAPGESPDVVDVGELDTNYPRKAIDEFQKGDEDYVSGNLEKAAGRLETALTEAPGYFPAHSLLGVIYHKLGRFPEAEKHYERAHELRPKAVEPMVNLGSLFLNEADSTVDQDSEASSRLVNRAIGVLQEAIALDRSYRITYYMLGAAYYKSGSLGMARTNFELAREIESDEYPVRFMLVNIDLKQKKWEEAIDRLDSWRSENPGGKERERVDELRAQVLRNLESRTR